MSLYKKLKKQVDSAVEADLANELPEEVNAARKR